jgi:hypothetical protein
MITFFKNNKILAPILVPIIGLFFWWEGFQNPPIIAVKNAMPLFELLVYVSGFSLLSKSIVAYIMLLVCAFYFNYLVDAFGLLKKKSFVPALIFLMLMSSGKSMLCLQPAIPAILFLLVALHKLMLTYRKELDLSDFFDASFFISLASLFYFPSFLFFPLVWVALIVIRPFIWREWIVTFFGFALPYIFVFVWYYYFGKVNVLLQDKIFFPEDFEFVLPYKWPNSFLFYTLILSFFLVVSVIYFFIKIPVNTIFTRNLSVIFIWLLILSFLVYLMAPYSTINYLSFISIPISFYLTNLFLEIKKTWINELFFLLLVAGLAVNLLELDFYF